MIAEGLNPALILIIGGLLAPLLSGRVRAVYMLALPLLGIIQLCGMSYGSGGIIPLFDLNLTTLRLDRLSFIFTLIFLIASWLGVIYALHIRDALQDVAALVYAGAAIGAVLAGDLVTLFIYWELTAISSVFLIWARRSEAAFRAGLRYLVVQVGSGVLLLAGLIVHFRATGSIAFDHLGLETPGGLLIFLAFGIKCAFPLLHNWLQDAYPQATVTGAVVLSAFTTKLAVYALARGYAGTEILIYIGATMTAFPIFFAVIENDLRKVLAYSLNNQLGFMVVGIGIGTELALNGTAAHAFCHILYKALLFMSMGAVLFRTGTIKASELGGLYKSMPLTAGFCIVGSLSISAFPLFSGFVSKSLIMAAAAEEHRTLIFLVLLFASAGVLDHSGIKIPFFSFFYHDSGKRCAEAPANMLAAMGLTALACVALGLFPQWLLYPLLPYLVDYAPYTTSHVLAQMQLLLFAALAFTTLMKTGLYPPEIRSINLDFDWTYRKLLPAVILRVWSLLDRAWGSLSSAVECGVTACLGALARHHGPHGKLASTWPTGSMVFWAVALLGICLVFYYL
ncbi:MAG: Na(+)/H(+) antiporter subunit D [Gammaproteobacteria bacterium]|nr:Na(+)/H(+) antiporter subunit D [Gammaproteobacteria bacterium]